MAYLVLAYPELSNEDWNRIQNYRKDHDALFYEVVQPHFTLVFPLTDLPEKVFIDEIKQLSASFKKIDFTLRCATINKDAFSDYYHTFLVPDEGYSKIVKLHDQLYRGKLKNHCRLDIDYIPHIGIGNSKDASVCKEMVDQWNSREFSITGKINQLTIVKYENKTVTKIHETTLQ